MLWLIPATVERVDTQVENSCARDRVPLDLRPNFAPVLAVHATHVIVQKYPLRALPRAFRAFFQVFPRKADNQNTRLQPGAWLLKVSL